VQHQTKQTECNPCAPGTFQNSTGETQCMDCACGQYYDLYAAPACLLCDAGQFEIDTGSTECTDCFAGSFTGADGACVCESCAKGQFQGENGKTSCTNCTLGHVQPDGAQTSCDECVVGKYMDSEGQLTCKDCKKGTSLNTTAAPSITNCTDCTAGKHNPTLGAETCTECLKGTFSTSIARILECDNCVAGQYQVTTGQTSCVDCKKGKHGDSTESGAFEDTHCTHCPGGQFVHVDASVTCVDCPSGKYTNHLHESETADSAPHHTCTACSVVDSLRYYWTENQAGWDNCTAHPVSCEASGWGDYGGCSKSCNPLDEDPGTHERSATVIHGEWGGQSSLNLGSNSHQYAGDYGTLCQDLGTFYSSYMSNTVWNGGGSPVTTGNWTNTEQCNTHACPIDCQVSEWSSWGGCSKSCGTGSATQTRTITTPVQYGGKICPTLTQSQNCNPHVCVNSECHVKHVSCKVQGHHSGTTHHYTLYHNGTHNPDGSLQAKCASNQPNCWQCDSALECKQKNSQRQTSTIKVKHDRFFSEYDSHFVCKGYFPYQPDDCKCRCSRHPTGCYQKNKVYTQTSLNRGVLFGNWHRDVASINACSNLCAHHPTCEAWEYDTGMNCLLRATVGAVSDNTESATVTTYIGTKTGTTGCIVKGPQTELWTDCHPGQYKFHANSTSYCLSCPTGKFSRVTNADSCETGSWSPNHENGNLAVADPDFVTHWQRDASYGPQYGGGYPNTTLSSTGRRSGGDSHFEER